MWPKKFNEHVLLTICALIMQLIHACTSDSTERGVPLLFLENLRFNCVTCDKMSRLFGRIPRIINQTTRQLSSGKSNVFGYYFVLLLGHIGPGINKMFTLGLCPWTKCTGRDSPAGHMGQSRGTYGTAVKLDKMAFI